MKNQFGFMTVLALGLSILSPQGTLQAAAKNETVKAGFQQEDFDRQLQEELSKQGADILNLEKQVIQKNKDFEGDLKKEFEGKINSLEAKQILYKKFQRAPSLQNAVIREKLVELFKKPIITEKDIQEFQTVVDQQKAIMQKESFRN